MRHSFILLISVAVVLMMSGCSKNIQSPDPRGEEVTVTITLGGELNAWVDQEEITKSGSPSDDAYGINVFYDKENDGVQDDPYAYGLFDNVGDMSITLLSGHKYKFECTLVKDARSTLYFAKSTSNSGYSVPFQTNMSSNIYPNNKFIIGSSAYFTEFNSGKARMIVPGDGQINNADNLTECASINRFYGEISDYEPIQGSSIDIYLKRVVFGAKFVVNGLQNGSLDVDCSFSGNDNSKCTFYGKEYYSDNSGKMAIYTFPNPQDIWKNESPMSCCVCATYKSDQGRLWDIIQNQVITFKRNVMTTVTIQINPDPSRVKGYIFNISEEEMDEDNDINMGINADGLIDTIVNPVE